MAQRRRVDWPIILGPDAPVPTVMNRRVSAPLGSLLSTYDEVLALRDTDTLLCRTVELARRRIGLDRVAIFLLDEARGRMLGTWGTALDRAAVDEHAIMYDVNDTDREAFRRADRLAEHYTVFDNCPIVEHRAGRTRIAGRGWVAATPIRSSHATIGMMFNDTGLSGERVDEVKQGHAALVCSLLGALLDPIRDRPEPPLLAVSADSSDGHPMIAAALTMLGRDPSIGGKELAARLHISLSRLARVFKVEMGMSLVTYRNRLRLERFMGIVNGGETNLLEAALTAGFGSYAQFHRVFRAQRSKPPREVLRHRG